MRGIDVRMTSRCCGLGVFEVLDAVIKEKNVILLETSGNDICLEDE